MLSSSFSGETQTYHSSLTIENSAKRLVAHLGSQRVRANGDEFEASSVTAVRALRSDGFIIEHFKLIRFQPHELGALWAGSDLR